MAKAQLTVGMTIDGFLLQERIHCGGIAHAFNAGAVYPQDRTYQFLRLSRLLAHLVDLRDRVLRAGRACTAGGLPHETERSRNKQRDLGDESHQQERRDDRGQKRQQRPHQLLHGQTADGHANEETQANRRRDVADG
jgi:hypothetical protein